MDIYLLTNLIVIILALLLFLAHKITTERKKNYSIECSLKESSRTDVTNNVLYCSVIFVWLLFISTFRGPFTADYGNYLHIYNKYKVLGIAEILKQNNIDLEYGYLVLNRVTMLIYDNYITLLFIISFIILICYFRQYRKYSNYVWLSILLLLCIGSYYTSFNTLRQFLAASITFLAGEYIYKKNFLRYLILVIVAFLIHKTSVIMIPFYFILQVNWNRKKSVLFGAIVIVILVLSYVFTNDIVNLLRTYVYSDYSSSDSDITQGLSIINFIRPFLIVLFCLIYFKYINLNIIEQRVWFNATLFFLVVSIFSMQISLAIRFTYFFLPYTTLIIPKIIYSMPQKLKRIGFCILFVIFLFFYSLVTHSLEPLPYKFVNFNSFF